MQGIGTVTGVRVTQEHADSETRADARVEDEAAAVSALLDRPAVDEAFVLYTCQRVEAYAVTEDQSAGRAALADHLDVAAGEPMDHEGSIRHLLRVAAGLESVVLGEDQVLGQLRDAREAARDAGGIGPTLDPVLRKALRVGERARTETAINEGTTSLGSAAVELARQKRSLAGADALVVGAGEMGTRTAKALVDAGVGSLTVANRTVERAEATVEDLDAPATATGLADLPAAVGAADVVVTATGSQEPLLSPADLADAGDTVVVDIGQPHDVAPGATEVSAVERYALEDIEAVTAETRARRDAAANEVAAIVDEEYDRLIHQFKRGRADDVIGAMYEGAERIRDRELEEALTRLESETDGEVSTAQREVVTDLADALVSQLLAAPTQSLRRAAAEDDWETISTAIGLFDPADAPDLPDAPGDVAEGAADDD